MSSTEVDFDRSARIATTRSGRKYLLIGEPGISDDEWYVFSQLWGILTSPVWLDEDIDRWLDRRPDS
ncbi:hypothetical protein [Methylomagnum ishizawai]|uniref:hypothetical protein n=1 Tax=Methylomagnum ishizawai TaxID=1760988 RepID=UPI000A14675B|nr:hypothetical protein [Methylomagnum ishizawai]